MTIHTFWMFAFCLLAVAVLTESFLPEHITYVRDTLTPRAFVMKTWTCRAFLLSFIVSKGNETLLTAVFDRDSSMKEENRLLIKYNYRTKEVSLMINNVTKGDEGLYQISSHILQEAANGFDAISKIWNVQLNVLEPGDIKQGYAGENIVITKVVKESISFPRFYHNDQLIAVLRGFDCDVSTSSPFYGRIRCSKDKDSNTTRIEIKNVTENDTGLYKVETEGSLTQRCFLNITGIHTNSTSALISITPPDRCDEKHSDQTRNKTLPATVLSSTAVNQAHSLTYTTSSNVLKIATDPESSNVINSDQPSNETLPATVFSRSAENPANSLNVPIYVIPVIIGAVGIINVIGCLIWGQRRKMHMTKAEQHIPKYECNPDLYLTPLSLEQPLTLPTCQEKKTGHSNMAQNTTLDPTTGSIHMAQRLSKDAYEVVYISNNDDPEITSELDEITSESTENCNTRYSDTSGYLTVLGRTETTV